MSRSDSYSGEHTKYPPLISCLTWVNVWTMLEVFPDGLAVCRQNAGNKTSSSSIIHLVSKPRLPFVLYLGYLTSNSNKIFLTTRMSNCFFMSVSAKQIIRLNYYSITQDCCHFNRKNIWVGNNKLYIYSSFAVLCLIFGVVVLAKTHKPVLWQGSACTVAVIVKKNDAYYA